MIVENSKYQYFIQFPTQTKYDKIAGEVGGQIYQWLEVECAKHLTTDSARSRGVKLFMWQAEKVPEKHWQANDELKKLVGIKISY